MLLTILALVLLLIAEAAVGILAAVLPVACAVALVAGIAIAAARMAAGVAVSAARTLLWGAVLVALAIPLALMLII